ncbi:MAG: hypothetical protein RBT63_05920, partial [Bdellovibrionales bacterium]|nr:hypothetical protein [Bdellovibrionales bacterium]
QKHVQTTNEYRSLSFPPNLERARKIYRSFFDYGWTLAPYNTAHSLKTHVPSLNRLAYMKFVFSRWRPILHIRRLHRKLYVTLRSAWLNGGDMIQAAKQVKKAR